MKPTISILGCGWLGLPLGAALVQDGYTVRGSTRSTERTYALAQQGIRPYVLSIDNGLSGNVGDFFASEVLVLTLPPGRQRDDVAGRYPGRIASVLAQALAGGVRHILFTSSTSVYGPVHGKVTEHTPPAPDTGSAQGVLAAERLLQDQKTSRVTVLRLAGLIGPGRHPGRFLAGRQGVANGHHPVNLLHLRDGVAALQRVIQEGAWGRCFNVCADEHPTRMHYYTHTAVQLGLEPPTFLPAPPDSPPGKVVCNDGIKSALGFAFEAGVWGPF